MQTKLRPLWQNLLRCLSITVSVRPVCGRAIVYQNSLCTWRVSKDEFENSLCAAVDVGDVVMKRTDVVAR
jgi:hypothetical protein